MRSKNVRPKTRNHVFKATLWKSSS